jgi:hypothetical protein
VVGRERDFGFWIKDFGLGKKSALFALPGLGDAVETYESWGWRVSGEWVMG